MKFCASLSTFLFLAYVPLPLGQSYPASGMVLRADRVHLSLDVSCQAIPDYADAKVQRFRVRDAHALEGLEPGLLIDFVLQVHKSAAYADQIHVHKYENSAQEPMAARQLEILDAATRTAHTSSNLQLGQHVPDFTLFDQKGQKVALSEFRGKLVALTFFYTRCPLPNFCFRMSNNFGVLRHHFASRVGKDLILLSITFDPDHDQPETLAEYSRTWTDDATGWFFLTGPAPDVNKICREFGVTSWQDEGLMTHSLHTIIIDRQGRIVANLEGNEYTAQQLTDLIEVLISPST